MNAEIMINKLVHDVTLQTTFLLSTGGYLVLGVSSLWICQELIKSQTSLILFGQAFA